MSYINTSQAAKILGVSKKTLLRWDEAGKFSPDSREKVSRGRVYKKEDVLNLKKLQEHEEKFQKNLKEIRRVQDELNPYSNANWVWLSNREIKLLEKENELLKIHKKLVDEFKHFGSGIKKLYKQFYVT